MERQVNVMFAGASGVGKTTSANYIAETLGIDFVSGSVSDLLPKTKEMPHAEMLARDSKTLIMEDYQILNLRNKKFKDYVEKGNSFVSDRSYLDSAAYFLYKQADKIPACEVEAFLALCKQLLNVQCSHLILFDFGVEMLHDWVTEDNSKRITNNYFQMEITTIMKMVLGIWEAEHFGPVNNLKGHFWNPQTLDYGAEIWKVNSVYGSTSILLVKEVNKEIRNKLICQYLNGQL